MIKKITYILLFISLGANAQLGLFKYSTFYGSVGINQVLDEVNTYTIENDILIETTRDNKYNYRYAFGVRRLARLSMEDRKNYKDGTETDFGKFRSSLMSGLEYLVSYENVRDRGISYINQDYFLRYISSLYVIKLQSTNLQGIDLKYREIDLRLKKDFNKLQVSLGAVMRFHPAYSLNPFSVFSGNDYVDVAKTLGYNTYYWFTDFNNNGFCDRTEPRGNGWIDPVGDTIASTGSEFMKYHYSDVVNKYNTDEINKMGTQRGISAVIGMSYYTHRDNYHTLIWTNVLPYHKPITEYGFSGGVDYEIGVLIQKKLTKILSIYTEGIYLRYLDRKNYNIKIGLNILIK
tara:strand:- start:7234 stop:8274 length:1041 start_codon:yes stop_codon:yes gene_type:complete